MENIAPLLKLCTDLRYSIESGDSLQASISKVSISSDLELKKQVLKVISYHSANKSLDETLLMDVNYYRRYSIASAPDYHQHVFAAANLLGSRSRNFCRAVGKDGAQETENTEEDREIAACPL